MIIKNCNLFSNEERQFNYEIKDQRGFIAGLSEIDMSGQLLDRLGCPVGLSGDYELIARNAHSIVKKLSITLIEGKLERIKR